MATTATTTATPPPGELAGDRRAVRRVRGLPGGRAVVGALLVAASAVGVFGAYLGAMAEPDVRYLVARATVDPGTRLDAAALRTLFEPRPLHLDDDLAARAVRLEDAESLLGRLVIAPMAPGDLLSRRAVVADGGIAAATTLSFAVDASAAVAGALHAGERVDVLATYGSGDGAYTAYVVRGVPLVAIAGDGGGGGLAGGVGRGSLTLTVAVSEPERVQALAHAVATADLVVTRSSRFDQEAHATPPPYRPAPDAPGPVPDVGGVAAADPDASPGPDTTAAEGEG